VSSRPRIAIDMDEVLVDTLTAQLAWFRDRYGHTWSRESLTGRSFWDVAPAEHCRTHFEALALGEFFEDLPPMPGAVEAVRELSGRFEVVVATAAMEHPGSLAPKYRWLRRHLAFVPASHYVFCGDKSVVAADYLIDDNAYQFERFAGVGVLFSAPHNARVASRLRVNGWDDALRLFARVGAGERVA
jgi:5'(3')-deoxyribonucleotidase